MSQLHKFQKGYLSTKKFQNFLWHLVKHLSLKISSLGYSRKTNKEERSSFWRASGELSASQNNNEKKNSRRQTFNVVHNDTRNRDEQLAFAKLAIDDFCACRIIYMPSAWRQTALNTTSPNCR